MLLGLLMVLAAAPADANPPVTVSGVVRRPPAVLAAAPAPSRYRERGRHDSEQATESAGAGCACNPGLFAVVEITGDNLPAPDLTMRPPTMAQKDRMFVPSVLAVPVGGSIEFPNQDPFFHNVFSYSKTKKFDLGRYPEGESASVTFLEPGIVPVFCEIHYSMRAYIHVVETPWYDVTAEDRRFEILGVRPGEYTIRVWQEGLPDLVRPLVVEAGADSVWVEIP
ncbi:MAG: hypothetical protein KC591_01830 [Gemmatimonadetes bacterium]|nr:hypothetical protein [Gemmatimonadota bacterium]